MSSTSKTLSKATKVHVEIPSETLRSKRRAKFHDPTVKCAFDSSGIDEPLHMFYIFGICKYDIYFFFVFNDDIRLYLWENFKVLDVTL